MNLTGSFEIFQVNGLKVLFHRNESFLTNIQILTRVGSAAEEPDVHGMAHILEHMFFKGSRKRPGGNSISRAANDIGGKLNAYTTYDHTVYYITVLNENFRLGLDILSDMYQNPLFPEEEFRKELNPILSEFREREDDPDSFLMERALAAYMGMDYHPVIGQKETIENASVEGMFAFKKRYYGGGNTMIAVIGRLSREEVETAIREQFTVATETSVPPRKLFPYSGGELGLTKAGIQEAYYQLYYPALDPGHPDRYKQDIMCYMLGGNDSALLFERIREDLGMSCYGIYAYLMRFEPFSLLSVVCGIAPDELDRLETEVNGQIQKICETRLNEDQLQRAKASLRTSIAAKSETSGGLGSMISVAVLRGETEHPVEKALVELDAITVDEVREAAAQTFGHAPFRAVLLPA